MTTNRTEPADCPFCGLPADRMVAESPHGIAIEDAYPVSPGHTLVLPREHVASLWDLPHEAQADLWELAGRVRRALAEERDPAGFNVGVNDGAAAGQTVAHAHIHVIPRYDGDVPDPRGGVRHVIPARAAYWSK